MRVWQIILTSAIAAAVAGAAVIGWTVAALDHYTWAAITAAVYSAAPLIGSVWLGTYALCTLVLVTALLSRALRQAGREVEQSVAAIAANPAELANRLPTALHRFNTQLCSLVFGAAPEPQATLALRLSNLPARLRGACRWLYVGLLVRSQYPTALAILLALALVQLPAVLLAKNEPLRGFITAMPAVCLLLALIAFVILEHLMTSTHVAPFVRALTLLPIESQETLLLRQLLERIHAAPDPSPSPGLDADRLRALVDEAQQPVLRIVTRMADAIKGLDRAARSDLDGIKAALTELVQPTHLGEDAALQSEYRQAVDELRSAVSAISQTIATLNELSSTWGDTTAPPRPTLDGAEPASVAFLSLLRELELLSRDMDVDL